VIRIAWVQATWSLVCYKIQIRSDKVAHTVPTTGPKSRAGTHTDGPSWIPQPGRHTFKIVSTTDRGRVPGEMAETRSAGPGADTVVSTVSAPAGGRIQLYQLCPPPGGFWAPGADTVV